jgi:hypothetical protein
VSERNLAGAVQDIATAMILPAVVFFVAAETLSDLGHPEWHPASDVVLNVFLVLGILGRWPQGAPWVRAAVKLGFAVALAVRLFPGLVP